MILLRHLPSDGHEVHIIAKVGFRFRTGFSEGMFFHSYSNVDVLGFRLLTHNFQLFTKLIRIKPDLCFGVMFESALGCYGYARIFSKPCAVRLAGDDFYILHSRLEGEKRLQYYKKELVFLVPYPAIFNIVKKEMPFVVLNEAMAEGLLELGIKPENVHLIYNPIADYFFETTSKVENLTVIFCGRIVPQKGVDTLVRAFALVVKSVPSAKLILVGDGVQRLYIEKLILDLELASYVRITGVVPRYKVQEFLSKAALFVLSSNHEGTPNTLLQAMAIGLPVVATRVGGVPDIITDGVNGLLIQPNDVNALAEAIQLLLVDKGLAKKLGENANKKASVFKMETIVGKYVDLFNGLTCKIHSGNGE